MDDVKKEKAKVVLLSSIAVLDIITNLAVLKKGAFPKRKAPKKIDPNVTAAILNSIVCNSIRDKGRRSSTAQENDVAMIWVSFSSEKVFSKRESLTLELTRMLISLINSGVNVFRKSSKSLGIIFTSLLNKFQYLQILIIKL